MSPAVTLRVVKCHRCDSRASIPLDAVRRPRDTPIWKLEPAFRCRTCGTRYRPPVHMIKLTETREIAPYPWTHSVLHNAAAPTL